MGEAFACFGLNQRGALWEILAYRILTRPTGEKDLAQLNLFENLANGSDSERVHFTALSQFQAIRSDYSVYGLSTRGHPMQELRRQFKGLPQLSSALVKQRIPPGRTLKAAGLVIARQRPPNAKGVCFATLEDEDGFLDLVLYGDVFEKYHDVFVNEPFIIVTGKVQKQGSATTLLVSKVETISEEESRLRVRSKDFG